MSSIRDEIKSSGKFAIRSSDPSLPPLSYLKQSPPLDPLPPSYLKRTTDREFPRTFDFIPNVLQEIITVRNNLCLTKFCSLGFILLSIMKQGNLLMYLGFFRKMKKALKAGCRKMETVRAGQQRMEAQEVIVSYRRMERPGHHTIRWEFW